jgi:hypothetical protein
MYVHDVHYYRDFKITAIRNRIDDAKNRLWSGLSLSSSLAIISSPSLFPQLPGSPLVFTPPSSVTPYLRAIHAELDTSLRKFIRDNPLGILITVLPSLNFPTLQCTHIPWVLDVTDEHSETELGKLRRHLAKPNPHSKAMMEAIQAHTSSNGSLQEEVTVLFNGPVHN